MSGYLWNTDYNNKKIYRLTTNGTVNKSFASIGTVPRGLTWQETSSPSLPFLYTTGIGKITFSGVGKIKILTQT